MIHPTPTSSVTVRAVYADDPNRKLRLSLLYPPPPAGKLPGDGDRQPAADGPREAGHPGELLSGQRAIIVPSVSDGREDPVPQAGGREALPALCGCEVRRRPLRITKLIGSLGAGQPRAHRPAHQLVQRDGVEARQRLLHLAPERRHHLGEQRCSPSASSSFAGSTARMISTEMPRSSRPGDSRRPCACGNSAPRPRQRLQDGLQPAPARPRRSAISAAETVPRPPCRATSTTPVCSAAAFLEPPLVKRLDFHPYTSRFVIRRTAGGYASRNQKLLDRGRIARRHRQHAADPAGTRQRGHRAGHTGQGRVHEPRSGDRAGLGHHPGNAIAQGRQPPAARWWRARPATPASASPWWPTRSVSAAIAMETQSQERSTSCA